MVEQAFLGQHPGGEDDHSDRTYFPIVPPTVVLAALAIYKILDSIEQDRFDYLFVLLLFWVPMMAYIFCGLVSQACIARIEKLKEKDDLVRMRQVER